MPFALLVSLLLLVSTAVLLYQFWTGALAPADKTDAAPRQPQRIEHRDARAVETPSARPRRFHVDSAA